MSSYEAIKEHISSKLKRKATHLEIEQGDIPKEIANTQKTIATIGLEHFANVIGADNLEELPAKDWERLQREIETSFNVRMNHGILIQQNEEVRDNTWWTGSVKQQTDCYYSNRYRNYLSGLFPPNVVKIIDEDTDVVLNNLENPSKEAFDRRGMVVGHVQSGKTGNYASLICKAADAGYKFIVVIAGGLNNLRDQTQKRLNESFVGFSYGTQVGAGSGDTREDKTPVSLTTEEKDFNKHDADRSTQAFPSLSAIKTPVIVVIKKNTNTLKNVINWFKKMNYKPAMLMIDDESDYASINTKVEDDPTTINKHIRELLFIFPKSAYVAYTATPYANIFIDHAAGHDVYSEDLFPRDFIYAINAPNNYFGAKEIFNEDRKYLVPINDWQNDIPLKHSKEYEVKKLPDSLYEAIRVFALNIAVRKLLGQGNQHNSMLIHATRFTNVHNSIYLLVDGYLDRIKKEIITFGKLQDAAKKSELINDLKLTFKLRHKETTYSWKQVLVALCSIINTVVTREVHQRTRIPLEYRKESPTNAIVIGGASLSRGYTLEGLSVSYFLRNTIFYDTLMQMGRWFGYREGYQDLCKIYMPESIIQHFRFIIEATDELIADFERMNAEKMTPKDFGLAVQQHPDSMLQVTARNKQKNTKDIYFTMNLSGRLKETAYLHVDPKINEKNISAIKKIVSVLDQQYADERKQKNNSFIWRNVNKETINTFLTEFEAYSSDPYGINTRMPIKFIRQYVEEENTAWDVAILAGELSEFKLSDNISIKKEKRQLDKNSNGKSYYEIRRRQISSGSAEAIAFDDNELIEMKKVSGELGRQDLRSKMKKPLLMLHILEIRDDDDNVIENNLAAFGVSFHGGVASKSQGIKLKINSVWLQEFIDEGDDSDD